jgi:hypothetical protein
MFVQFPHPGSEHEPTGPWMEWNRRAHARKFLRAHGTYIADGEPRTGPFTFWGEWEPQSRVLETFQNGGRGYPRWLQEPFWRVPRHPQLLQNTDPLVFGDHFLYSNCRQGRNRKLRELAPGSLVVFGSKFQGEFVVDTVLVVGEFAQRVHGGGGRWRGSLRGLDPRGGLRAAARECETRGAFPALPREVISGSARRTVQLRPMPSTWRARRFCLREACPGLAPSVDRAQSRDGREGDARQPGRHTRAVERDRRPGGRTMPDSLLACAWTPRRMRTRCASIRPVRRERDGAGEDCQGRW